MRAHALLSASGSSRWMACPPSARLEEEFEDTSSDFAREGTIAHDLADLYLSKEYGQIDTKVFKERYKKVKESEFYNQEMEDYIKSYVDFVIEKVNEHMSHTPDTQVLLEQRLNFSNWVPEGFGTGDVVIVSDHTLEVIDLKYGKGVPVYAEDNSQMRLYALGAWYSNGFLYNIKNVRTTIAQPRLDNISTEEITLEALLAWGQFEVEPAAELAFAGRGEFKAGDHCRFCKVKYTCRARTEANLELAKYDFKKPDTLDHDEVADILAKAEELQKWAKDIQDYALDQAEKHGVKFPGWKLVEGRSNRKYTDDVEVKAVLLKAGYEESKILKEPEILGITAMEKVVGKKKFSELLEDLIVKPAGKPTLVPESDKRPEINSLASAEEDFK